MGGPIVFSYLGAPQNLIFKDIHWMGPSMLPESCSNTSKYLPPDTYLFLLLVLIHLPDALLKILNSPENIKFAYSLQDVPSPLIIIFLILHQHALPYAEVHSSI